MLLLIWKDRIHIPVIYTHIHTQTHRSMPTRQAAAPLITHAFENIYIRVQLYIYRTLTHTHTHTQINFDEADNSPLTSHKHTRIHIQSHTQPHTHTQSHTNIHTHTCRSISTKRTTARSRWRGGSRQNWGSCFLGSGRVTRAKSSNEGGPHLCERAPGGPPSCTIVLVVLCSCVLIV